MKRKQETIKVPDKLMTFNDERTGVKTVVFPVVMGDGTPGALAVTRLKNEPWNPSDSIDLIIIKWKLK